MKDKDKDVRQKDQALDASESWKACPGKCTNQQIQKREALLQAKSNLINNMIYHIRTLSNAVIGFSDLLSVEQLGSDETEYVEAINQAGKGLSVLANEVLDWTQLLSGKLQIEKAKFCFSEILYEIHKILAWASREKGLDYEIVTDPQMPAYIFSDENRLLKCLVNLTTSAVKFTSQGSVQIHVQMEQHNDEPHIRFDVIDTGLGIESEKLSRIFEPTAYRIEMDEEILSQLDKGLTVTAGLPLTKRLCELLGGTIGAKSQVGQGSTFTMRIPAGVDPTQEPQLGDLSWTDDDTSHPSNEDAETIIGTILLVEDQPSNRTVISLMLEALGVQVDTAESGQEAIRKTMQNTYHLILMDLKMPDMDGYETMRCIRQQGVEIPIVALSAKVLDQQESHNISMVFDGFVTKPVDSKDLSKMLKKFLKGYLGDTDKTALNPDENEISEYEITTTEYDNGNG